MKGLIILTPFVSAAAHAATVMIHPASIAYINSPNQELSILNNETNIIDGSGLSATPTVGNVTTVSHAGVSTTPSANAWATIDPGGFNADFFASGGSPPMFTIDLGSAYSVTDFVIWGYHFGTTYNGNHPRAISLEFSTNGGGTYGSPINVAITGAVAHNMSEIVSFSAQTANFVRMRVTDNFFGIHIGGDRVGIAEIRFMGDAVPEPGGILLPSIGVLFLLRRCRRSASRGVDEDKSFE